MSQTVIDDFTAAASGILQLPDPFLDLKLKDNIPVQADWDSYNTSLCKTLTAAGCMTIEGELDDYWDNNQTFNDMMAYLDAKCNYTPIPPKTAS